MKTAKTGEIHQANLVVSTGKAILVEITTGRSPVHVIATRLLFRSVANGCRTLDHDDILPSLGDKPPCSRSCRDRSD